MQFEIITEIGHVETIAIDTSIREISRLRKTYGEGCWRKLKRIASIRLSDGYVVRAELHWYECYSIDKKEIKIKRFLK